MPDYGTTVARGDANLLLRGVAANFVQSMRDGQMQATYPRYCQKVSSRSLSEKYVFAGAFPKPRKWTDERAGAGGLVTFNYEIVNERIELTVEIDGDYFADDQVGIVLPWLQEAGMSLAHYRDEQFNTMREAGNATACFDAQYFHATSHQMESETAQSNYVDASAFGSTFDEQELLFNTASMALKNMTDSKGRKGVANPASLPGLTVTIPANATLYRIWRRILFGGLITDGEGFQAVAVDNQNRGLATLVADPLLTSSTSVYFEVLGLPQRPYIFQEREAPTVDTLGFDSEHYKKTGNIMLLARERYAFGYGLWWRSMRYHSIGS